jgi:uncharacterized membrane protein
MRKTLAAVSLIAFGVLFWVTGRALYGPDRLPDKIPTHFDFAGHPNAWGSTATLILLPAIAVVLYVGISVTQMFPSAYNYPVRVTPQNRPRLQALAIAMIDWLKTELVCLFAWIQWSTIAAARGRQSGLSPALMPVSILAIFGSIGWHFVAMRRAARDGSER